ncbi:hypothetical protein KSD_03700 [Ktedonobacter sp. SOSP1-85]|nr:hypothetical protein KSD_03700 [Ktedonobacter sp. SOSP1-85]
MDPTKEVPPIPPGHEQTSYQIPLPPPPPAVWVDNPYDPYSVGKKHQRFWIYATIASLCILGSIGFMVASFSGVLHYPQGAAPVPPSVATTAPSQVTQQPPITPTPTVKTDYTADDILHDLNNAGIHPKFVQRNQTIWSWSQDQYQTTYPSTSSITFTDDSGCTGYCSPGNLGIWVYATPQIAQQTYNEVQQDGINAQLTPATGPTYWTSNGYIHGRCLLLGGDQTTVYGQVLTAYCV